MFLHRRSKIKYKKNHKKIKIEINIEIEIKREIVGEEDMAERPKMIRLVTNVATIQTIKIRPCIRMNNYVRRRRCCREWRR